MLQVLNYSVMLWFNSSVDEDYISEGNADNLDTDFLHVYNYMHYSVACIKLEQRF